jgi:hypothetical protein
VEKAAASEKFLWMATFFSVLGAPVEASGRSAITSVVSAPWSFDALSPEPATVVAASVLVDLEFVFAGIQAAVAVCCTWWRCSHRGAFDFFAVRGASQSKSWRLSGKFRRRGVVLGGDDDRVQEGFFVILSLFWAFL